MNFKEASELAHRLRGQDALRWWDFEPRVIEHGCPHAKVVVTNRVTGFRNNSALYTDDQAELDAATRGPRDAFEALLELKAQMDRLQRKVEVV
jgi:hypothetical protein